MRFEKMLRKVLISVIAVAVVAGFIVLIVLLAANPPQKTVGNFLKAIEKGDQAAMTETLSPDAADISLIVQTLAPGSTPHIRVILKDGLSAAQLEELQKAVGSMPEVAVIEYVPNKAASPKGITANSAPPELDITLKSASYYTSLAGRLSRRPEILVDPDTSRQEIIFPVSGAVRDYLSKAFKGARFTDLKYKVTSKDDLATVIILDGKILKLDKNGKMVPVTSSEFATMRMFPIGYTLKKRDGRWYITSFPNVQAQKQKQ